MKLSQLKNALVVSCQPVPGSTMDRQDIIVAMAGAAVAAGAGGLRIEGAEHVRAVVQALPHVPVIGIVKRDLDDTPVRITPYLADVQALIAAGAAVIAFDGTQRSRPVAVADLLAATHAAGRLAMADCSTLEDGLACLALGCDLIGTTLSGYTEETAGLPQDQPNLPLIAELSAAGAAVMAEGRIRTAADAAAALGAGAYCVTVGSAITRIEHITEWFISAMNQAIKKD
ncbi:N-acetylmannosamine-6-phosphate 2-epimerase [Duganella qianjiadongensis]|uniref:Putative N-acetylmannosamine-6-phosphate 2-epimerase n=1 Tax=Duganella qianjiadongensis TaxID=2692176 RepID=A0ABW9VFQ2_9BURK|nr:putative N-acetylmannosamine-6-phosphate 2-epimerase [Duganella qianjiadongensis]MYM37932.1 putative N-acetylmannosamine-6-phosphate 2-epimerase [Duganella qianjiadongensis]